MDGAVRELHCPDNGGVLVWFFELLWRPKPAAADQYLYAAHLPPIPDTVLLNFSRIQQWYFTPRNLLKLHGPKSASSRQQEQQRRTRSAQRDVGDGEDSDGAKPARGDDSDSAAVGGRRDTQPMRKKRGLNLTGRSIFGSFCGFDAVPDVGARGDDTTGDNDPGDVVTSRASGASTNAWLPSGLSDPSTIVAMLVCRSSTAATHNMIGGGSDSPSRRPASSAPGTPDSTRAGSRRGSVMSSQPRGPAMLDRAGPSVPRSSYFTAGALKELLFHGSLGETALLQHFVPPKTDQSTSSALLNSHNETLQVHWQWSSVTVVRHRNINRLGSDRAASERGETFEAGTNTFSSGVGTASIAEPIKLACNAIAEHVFVVSEQRVMRMSAVFKMDNQSRLVLLFVQSVHCAEKETMFRAPPVACPERLVATLLFAGRQRTANDTSQQSTRTGDWIGPSASNDSMLTASESGSPGRLSSVSRHSVSRNSMRHKSVRAARLHERQRQRAEREQEEVVAHGCSALSYREVGANATYERIIPVSWRMEHERNAQRRSALRAAATHDGHQSSPGPLRLKGTTSPAPGSPVPQSLASPARSVMFSEPSGSAEPDAVQGKFAEDESSHTVTPRSRARATRHALSKIQTALPGVVSMVVDDEKWSTVSRADAAILRETNQGIPFAKKNIAQDAARMGLADQYVRCMAAYSVGKTYEEATGALKVPPKRAASATGYRSRR